MNIRRLHTWVGLALLTPLLGWAVTGVIFLTKPGYARAYEPVEIRKYPIAAAVTFEPGSDLNEVRRCC